MVNARNKGRSGEYEAIGVLQPIVDRQYGEFMVPPVLERNLEQVRAGGADIRGLDWCEIEVKRVQKVNVKAWWSQVVKACEGGQRVPILMWRTNRQPWRFRVKAPVVTGEWSSPALVLESGTGAGRRR